MSTNSSNLYSTAGIQVPPGACVVIVRTEWNAESIDKLEAGCIRILQEYGLQHKVVTVPGAFEIAYGIKTYWDIYKHDEKPAAFVALGCVLRGDTPHFDYVCKAVTDGIVQLNLDLPVPTIFGILTVDTQEQIDERTGGKHGHKGEEAAITAIKMIALKADLTATLFSSTTP